MVKRKHRTIEGLIEVVTSKETRRAGYFRHAIKIAGHNYSYFNNDPVCKYKVGDTVRFQWWPEHSSRYRTPFRNIDASTAAMICPAELAKRIDGYIYILTNKSMPGLIKVGYTTGTPHNRAKELSGTTGVPTPFKVASDIPIAGNVQNVERLTHNKLANHRAGKEFFRTGVEHALAMVEEAYRELHPEQVHVVDESQEARELAHNKAVEQYHIRRQEENNRLREKDMVLPQNLWMDIVEDRPTPRSPRPGRVPPGSSPEGLGLKTRAPLGLSVG